MRRNDKKVIEREAPCFILIERWDNKVRGKSRERYKRIFTTKATDGGATAIPMIMITGIAMNGGGAAAVRT